jgi:hypothetical protein
MKQFSFLLILTFSVFLCAWNTKANRIGIKASIILTCNSFTIPLQSACGNQLIVIVDDLVNPQTGDVHLYDANNNYLGDPIVDIVSGGNSGGLDIEFQLQDVGAPNNEDDYLGAIYDLTCGTYSDAFSYSNCQ